MLDHELYHHRHQQLTDIDRRNLVDDVVQQSDISLRLPGCTDARMVSWMAVECDVKEYGVLGMHVTSAWIAGCQSSVTQQARNSAPAIGSSR